VNNPRLAALMSDPSPKAVDRFWAQATAEGTPLVEPCGHDSVLVTFVWRGEARSTRAGWSIDVPLTRLDGTDLWHGSQIFPAGSRTVYCIQHDGAESLPTTPDQTGPTHLDALNPRRMHYPPDPLDPSDVDGWASVLDLPGAPEDPWSTTRPDVEPGTLTPGAVTSAALGGEYAITVYRPAGVTDEELPALVVFDGYAAQEYQRVPTTLDNLIDEGRIPPLAGLFVHNFTDRRVHDLSPLPRLERFVADELLPWAHHEWGIGPHSGGNLIAGVSRGALVATHLGLRRPDLFRGVIAQSGSYWWPGPDEGDEPDWLIHETARLPRSGVRFYLDVGSQETFAGSGGKAREGQMSVCRAMRDVLTAQGHDVTYAEFRGGHDYLNWRRTFADGILAVCSAATRKAGMPAR
jgi:enterochelin esterase-like enzyme